MSNCTSLSHQEPTRLTRVYVQVLKVMTQTDLVKKRHSFVLVAILKDGGKWG